MIEKIKITETQQKFLMSLNEDEITDTNPETEVVEENLYENIERTFGNLEVRNLIKEGNEIKGELKSSYGIWNNMSWDINGEAKNIENPFKKLTYKIQL